MAEWIAFRCGRSRSILVVKKTKTLQVYSLIHVAQIWRSDHSGVRKIALMVESIYNGLNLLFTWFALANFYIFFVSEAIGNSAYILGHINQRARG